MIEETAWLQIYSCDGRLAYEGFTLLGKPYGAGIAFYSDGKPYQEGIFGIKGLLCGREYYPSGQLRFEGVYRLNRAYGPNYPIMGDCYDESGSRYYSEIIKLRFGGVGYPIVVEPKSFGPISQSQRPRVNFYHGFARE